MVNSGTSGPICGSTTRPSHPGRTPSRCWLTATKFHAAVPVSHEFLASPCRAASRPAIIWAYTYGSWRCTSEMSSRYAGVMRR